MKMGVNSILSANSTKEDTAKMETTGKNTTTTIFSKKEFVETEIVVKDIQEVVNISALMVNASSQDVFMHTSNAKLKMKLLY